MPNYCSNCIIISGDGIDEFRKTLNTADSEGDIVEFSLFQTVPFDEEKEVADDVWGTKWDIDDYEIIDNGDEIRINCETAWCPPSEWAKRCSEKFGLTIFIAFHEGGVAYWGVSRWENGVLTHDECNNYDDENFIDWESEDENGEYIIHGELKKHIEEYSLGYGG